MQSSPYSQAELNQYKTCPNIAFTGSHIAGLSNCIYCAEIFRRYRKEQGTLDQIIKKQEEPVQAPTLNTAALKYELENDKGDDEECGKLECMRAGWCMCD